MCFILLQKQVLAKEKTIVAANNVSDHAGNKQPAHEKKNKYDPRRIILKAERR